MGVVLVIIFLVIGEIYGCLVLLDGLEVILRPEGLSALILQLLGLSLQLLGGHVPLLLLGHLEVDQFDLKDECGSSRDTGRGASRSIAIIRLDLESGLLTFPHGGDSDVPTLDDFALAQSEFKGVSASI